MTADIPEELEAALAGDPVAAELFAALRRQDRADYCEHVRSAKRPETRLRRASKVLEWLHGRADRRAERESRGTADLGQQFDRILVTSAGDLLKQAGFRRRSGPRHWRRVGTDRVDLVDFHRLSDAHPEYAEFRLELSLCVPKVDRLLGWPVDDLAKVSQGSQLSMFDPHTACGKHFSLYADVDQAALSASLHSACVAAVDEFDAMDTETLDGVLAIADRHFRGLRPLVLAGFGQLDAAQEELLRQPRPGRFDDPAQYPHPFDVRVAKILGVPGDKLAAAPLDGFTDPKPIIAELRQALPGVLLLAAPRHDKIAIQLLRPTEQDIATAQRIAGDADLDVESVSLSLGESLAVMNRLAPLLLERERQSSDLVAHVTSCAAGSISIDVHNLDAQTERLIREHVPDAVLDLSAKTAYPLAMLQKRERLAVDTGQP